MLTLVPEMRLGKLPSVSRMQVGCSQLLGALEYQNIPPHNSLGSPPTGGSDSLL